MASASFSAVRTALQARVATVSGLKAVHEFVPDSFSATPAAVVQPAPGDFLAYSEALDDIAGYQLYVTIFVEAADAVAAQRALDAFLAKAGTSSVYAAVNGTLGGVVADAGINVARNYRAETIDSVRYIAVDFPVRVMC